MKITKHSLVLLATLLELSKGAPLESIWARSNGEGNEATVSYDTNGKPTGNLPEGYIDLSTATAGTNILTDPDSGEVLGSSQNGQFDDIKLKIAKFYKWTTIASNTHWSNWHPASCAFDNTKSSQPTQLKFTTWVKHGTTGTGGFSLGTADVAAINAKVDIMKETDDVTELDETVPARSWGQEWIRWQVFQTRQRRQTCYHMVIGSGHQCNDEYAYFDTYTPVSKTTQRAWRTDRKYIDTKDCGNSRTHS